MDLRNDKWRSERAFEFAVDHIHRGKVMATRRALMIILSAHGVDLSDETRDRVMDCKDLEQLNIWVRRALVINSIDEIFAPGDHVISVRRGAQLTSSAQVRQSSTTP